MADVDLRRLTGRLNPYTKRALEAAAGLAVARGHYEVMPDHLLTVFAEDTACDVQTICRHFALEPAILNGRLQKALEGARGGNSGRPVLAPSLVEWLTDAWMVSSIDLGLDYIRSGSMLLALLSALAKLGHTPWADLLYDMPRETLRKEFASILASSAEEAGAPLGGAARAQAHDVGGTLAKYCMNFTEAARQGTIDPVFCRDREIQQIIDILSRRRKNNPLCVGDPGVGKTAAVEGLALKIAQGDVPEKLRAVELIGLDLGLLQAGASLKGEFEARLKSILDEIKASPKPIVLFIDEAHMMIGAGGATGGTDAANLLKPALARGELRTIAATTWSEYKKYFEKDAALARRFQLVKLDEPSIEDAITILRGLRATYEAAHAVYIRDDAIEAAAKLSARYVSGRLLPDKAVDVLDTASARVKLSLSAKPPALIFKEQRRAEISRARDALARDHAVDPEQDPARLASLEAEIARLDGEWMQLQERWNTEKTHVARILDLRRKLGISLPSGEEVVPPGKEDEASLRREMRAEIEALRAVQGRVPLISYEVTPEAVAEVIADWTGIPLGTMVRDEAAAILALADDLRARIIGQDQAIEAIDDGIRAAKAGVQNPGQPLGVFLFVGPSGVGKTELATALADQLFGGERFLISINMSEFQEKHTVSKLVGSPPGYVGYGEGGILTEAVRQRPYAVVLLDEVEKADLEVMNLFYQVFDKGMLSDGEGRIVDFKNTVIILTSNLGSDRLTALSADPIRPSVETLTAAIRPILSAHFKPALLARMQIVPFYPLGPEPLMKIVRLKLDRVGKRLLDNQKLLFDYSDAVVEAIAARCTEVETGARAIDHIVNRTILPDLATELLSAMNTEGEHYSRVSLRLDDSGALVYALG